MVAAGIGVFQPNANPATDWVIVISRERPIPNKMIVVYDSPGEAPEPGLDINRPSVQVVVRGDPDKYKDVMFKARRIADEFNGRPSQIVNGDIWASVTMQGDILPLGYDENERPQVSMTFNLIVHQGDLSNSFREDTGTGSIGGNEIGGTPATGVGSWSSTEW